MNTLVLDDTNSAGPAPDLNIANRNVLLRILDALAEWLMRQELRVINRAEPRH